MLFLDPLGEPSSYHHPVGRRTAPAGATDWGPPRTFPPADDGLFLGLFRRPSWPIFFATMERREPGSVGQTAHVGNTRVLQSCLR